MTIPTNEGQLAFPTFTQTVSPISSVSPSR
jgi:hypothetical protein